MREKRCRDKRRAIRMTVRITTHLASAFVALVALAAPARADLQICSRMSYVVEAAIATDDKGAATTRGWFRINPGQCRAVIQGPAPADTLYIHARALPVYGGSPLPQSGQANFCVGENSFVLPATDRCARAGQKIARFTAVKPSENDKGLTAYLAEDAEYDDEQARDAGIQRLLAIAGYDGGPIDGVRGAKTDAAIAQFIADNKLENTAAGRSDFFDALMAAAQRPNAAGFAWCNETRNTVMAALGFEDQGTVVTRGWYRIAPGKCLRPDLTGKPQRLYSFGEAVGADGQPLAEPGKQAVQGLSWGGSTILCTRNVKFELSDHKDCGNNGLTATGFATVELSGSSGTTVQFK
jgi:uncharacterized membrane protein